MLSEESSRGRRTRGLRSNDEITLFFFGCSLSHGELVLHLRADALKSKLPKLARAAVQESRQFGISRLDELICKQGTVSGVIEVAGIARISYPTKETTLERDRLSRAASSSRVATCPTFARLVIRYSGVSTGSCLNSLSRIPEFGIFHVSRR